jgi:DNA-directed RNA polymerase subunit RPC12/RpoP
MIRYTCSACGKEHQIGNEFGGRQAKCPACGSPLRIPDRPPEAISDKALEALAGKVAAMSPAREPAGESKGGSGMALAWKVLAGLTLAITLGGAAFAWNNPPLGWRILVSGLVTAFFFHTLGVILDLLGRIERNTRR